MTDNIFSFPVAKNNLYVDKKAIEDACILLDQQVIEITRKSTDLHGGVDPLAYEIHAYVVAIRRAMRLLD